MVQDAYECLIKPKTRAEYDAGLRELAAEEQSLFGERKARRQSKDEQERQKQNKPPPYVWNEDTNAPLFWTPGRKLIEGPKTDPEEAPVAYFKRSSLDKALVKVSAEVAPVQKLVVTTPSPTKGAHRRTQSSSLDNALVLHVPVAQEVAKSKVRPAVPSQPAYFYGQHQPQHLHGRQYSVVAAEDLAEQQARHRQLVESERANFLQDLERRKRAVERERRQKMQLDQEVRRRLAKKEEEMAAKYAEHMRVKDEMEKEVERLRIKAEKKAKRASAKQVRWGVVGDVGFEGAPVMEYGVPETGPYGSGWWSEPELPTPRVSKLKKRRMYT